MKRILTLLATALLTVFTLSGQELTNFAFGGRGPRIVSPEVKDGKVTVNVGSVDHPMIAEHYIEWVAIETNLGCRMTKLKPETAPKCVFTLEEGETVKEVLAYCNLHGLWKA